MYRLFCTPLLRLARVLFERPAWRSSGRNGITPWRTLERAGRARMGRGIKPWRLEGAMEKIVLTAQGLLEDSFRLGLRVLKSGFDPTIIVAIWRGGAPVGMAVQEIIRYGGVITDHIAIRTSSYIGVDQRKTEVAVFGLNYVL